MKIKIRRIHMTFPNATKGVKKLFTAEILKLISVICLAAGLISAVLAFVSAANKSEAGAGATAVAAVIFMLASSILIIIGGIIMLVGLVQAGRDEVSFKSALICILGEIIALAIAAIISANSAAGMSGPVMDLAAAGGSMSLSHLILSIANLLITIFIITGVIRLADKLNDAGVSNKGGNVLKIIVVVNVLVIIADIIALIFGANPATAMTCGILLIVALVLQIIQFFMYLSLLNNGKKMLANN